MSIPVYNDQRNWESYNYFSATSKLAPLLVLFLFSVLIGCNDNFKDANHAITEIDVDKADSVYVSDFVKQVTYIPLSNTNRTLIGNVDKVRMDEDRIYVLDMYQSVGVFVYDHSGNFLFKIQNFGRGPGEFMGPYDFTIDYENDEIVIYDARGMKICFYDKETGQFLREKLFEFRFRRFEAISDGFLFHTDNRPNPNICCNIIKTDKDLNIIDEFVRVKDGMRGAFFMTPTNFSKHDDTLFFYSHNDYNIYSSVNGDFSIYKSFDFGEKNAPEEYYVDSELEKRDKILGDNVGMILSFFKNDNMEYIMYSADNKFYTRISSSRSEKVIHTNTDLFVNDMNIGPEFVFALETFENSIIWAVQPYVLTNFLEKKRNELSEEAWEEFRHNNPKLMKLTNSITNDSNPYLVMTEIDF
ncbi:MAG: 6-bladed beta-propeller [Gracilimonas sp.]